MLIEINRKKLAEMSNSNDFERDLTALVSRLKEALDELDAVSKDLTGSAAQDLRVQAHKLREDLDAFIDGRHDNN